MADVAASGEVSTEAASTEEKSSVPTPPEAGASESVEDKPAAEEEKSVEANAVAADPDGEAAGDDPLPVFDMTNDAENGTENNAENNAENDAEKSESMPPPDSPIAPAASARVADESANSENKPPTKSESKIPKRAAPTHNRPLMFGLGISPCGEHGCGAVVRLRLEHVSFDFAYGVWPLLISYVNEDTEEAEFDFDTALVHVDGGVSIFFGKRKKGFQDGIRTQGIYNSILGPGGGVGWTRERQCSRFKNQCWKHFVLGVGSGVRVFPKFTKRVADHFDLADNEKTSPINVVQMYLSVTLMWYL